MNTQAHGRLTVDLPRCVCMLLHTCNDNIIAAQISIKPKAVCGTSQQCNGLLCTLATSSSFKQFCNCCSFVARLACMVLFSTSHFPFCLLISSRSEVAWPAKSSTLSAVTVFELLLLGVQLALQSAFLNLSFLLLPLHLLLVQLSLAFKDIDIVCCHSH